MKILGNTKWKLVSELIDHGLIRVTTQLKVNRLFGTRFAHTYLQTGTNESTPLHWSSEPFDFPVYILTFCKVA